MNNIEEEYLKYLHYKHHNHQVQQTLNKYSYNPIPITDPFRNISTSREQQM